MALVRISGTKVVNWKFIPPTVLQENLNYAPSGVQNSDAVHWFTQVIPDGLTFAAVCAQITTERRRY